MIQNSPLNLDLIADKSEQLKEYLECESLLGKFFNKVNYCGTNCVNLDEGKYFVRCFSSKGGVYIRGNVGCCLNDQFNTHSDQLSKDDLDLLNQQRIEKYDEPKNKGEDVLHFGKPCGYHTNNGCILKDHKGPVCLAYICESYMNHLKKEFGIEYNIEKTYILMENLLARKVNHAQLQEFKSEIKKFSELVDARKKG